MSIIGTWKQPGSLDLLDFSSLLDFSNFDVFRIYFSFGLIIYERYHQTVRQQSANDLRLAWLKWYIVEPPNLIPYAPISLAISLVSARIPRAD